MAMMSLRPTVTTWPSPRLDDGISKVTVYARPKHLLTWNERLELERPWWYVYTSYDYSTTFVCVEEIDDVRFFVTLYDLIGYWDWYYGTVTGFCLDDGWPDDGLVHPSRPKTCMIWRADEAKSDMYGRDCWCWYRPSLFVKYDNDKYSNDYYLDFC